MKPTHFESVFKGIDFPMIEEDWRITRSKIGPGIPTQMSLMRHDPVMRTALSIYLRDRSPAAQTTNISTIVNEQQAMFSFWTSGKKVFTVSESLGKLLLQTDLKCAKGFLKLPFPCIFIRFDGRPVHLYVPYDGSWLPIDGVYVFEVDEEYIDKEWWGTRDYSLLGLLMRDPNAELKTFRVKHLRFVAISEGDPAYPDRFVGNVLHSGLPWEFPDTEIIDDKFISTTVKYKMDGNPDYKDSMDDFSTVMELALLTIAYINSSGSQVEFCKAPAAEFLAKAEHAKGGKAKKAARRAARRSALDYYYVGRTIQVPSHAVESGTEEIRVGKTRYFKFRHQVRGHFRRYWLKEENLSEADRKAAVVVEDGWASVQRWIEPFWRGPELAETLDQRYRVEKP